MTANISQGMDAAGDTPDEPLHWRDIARRTGLPSGPLTRELVRLAQAGLRKREKRTGATLA